MIEDYCIENNIINELEEKPTAETVEIADVLRLKLKFEREEWRLVCEEAQRAHDAKKALQDAQLAAQHEARDLGLAELRKARELVTPFQEKEIDKYFAHFEKVADSLSWPKDSTILLLLSVLVGKAQEIFGSLSVEQSSNYEHVKEAILKAYELVPEAYR